MGRYVSKGDDPGAVPDAALLKYASARGWVVISLVAIQDDPNDGDLQCILVCPAVPRIGERVVLQDQTEWLVQRVDHVACMDDQVPVALPNVMVVQASGERRT